MITDGQKESRKIDKQVADYFEANVPSYPCNYCHKHRDSFGDVSCGVKCAKYNEWFKNYWPVLVSWFKEADE